MAGTSWRAPLVVLVCGGLTLALALGLRQSFGIFLTPMSGQFGWGREVFALAIALQNIVWGVTQPFVGMVADRYGSGRVVAVGSVVYGLGLYLMSGAATGAELDLSAGLAIGFALSGTSFAIVLSAVGRAFPPERRSFALGIAGAGGSLGQFVMVPTGQAFISGFGWSTALVIYAGLAFIMVPLAAALAGRSQAPADLSAPQSLRAALGEARTHGGYRYLNLGFFVCGFQVTFIMVHLPAYLTDRGVTPTLAATALGLIGLFNIVGSLACGYLGDRFSKKNVLSLLYLGRAIVTAAFILTPMTPVTVVLYVSIMGLLWLATVPLTGALVAQIFGPTFMATLFGVVFLSHQVGAFLGVWMGGYLYDLTGSYDVVWWLVVALGVAAALLHWPIDERAVVRPVATG
jgi:MFS family permease